MNAAAVAVSPSHVDTALNTSYETIVPNVSEKTESYVNYYLFDYTPVETGVYTLQFYSKYSVADEDLEPGIDLYIGNKLIKEDIEDTSAQEIKTAKGYYLGGFRLPTLSAGTKYTIHCRQGEPKKTAFSAYVSLVKGTSLDPSVYSDTAVSETRTVTWNTSSSTNSSSTSSSSSSSSSGSSSSSSTSFADGGVRTTGSGSSKADYTRSSSTSVKYQSAEVSYKASSAKVPSTVKIGGKTYAVTSIATGAFVSYSNLKEITIGSNIKRIGKGAFDGCTNLKTLTINTRKLIAKNIKGAFKGASIKTVYVPANKVQAYKKIMTKSITGNGNKISVKAKKTSKKK